MSSDGILFLGLVLAAFGTFALALGYQSFAEWRHIKSKRR